jgi:ubiquinone/menaquinone biosynthesis C-methylase UbiE
MTTAGNRQIDEAKLHILVGTMVNELGAAASGALIMIGDRLGLYKALADVGPATLETIARHTGTHERYLREWLSNQAASGYISYDAGTKSFFISAEQAAVFADEDSPVQLTRGYYSTASIYKSADTLEKVFRSGKGIEWGHHDGCLFCGVAKFFRPSYNASLVQEWLPALEGVVEKLAQGISVADVGCGYGSSTILMAKAFPNSTFTGYDFHTHSIEHARADAEAAGVRNVNFEVALAKDYPGRNFGLVTFFDCLHDMGDPVGAAKHVRSTLAPDGTWMVVEPFAGDDLADNLNPVGRAYYAFSTAVCTPTSLSQEVGLALGAQAGEKRLREVIGQAGFGRIRRAAETPFNVILEARD